MYILESWATSSSLVKSHERFSGFKSPQDRLLAQQLVQTDNKENIKVPHIGLLTHWGRVTHICVSKLTIIGSYNGLSPGRRQAII